MANPRGLCKRVRRERLHAAVGDTIPSVGSQDFACKMQLIAADLCQSGDRGTAGAVECCLKCPLAGQGDLGGQMAQGCDGVSGTGIVAAQFDAHRTLGQGRKPVIGFEQAEGTVGKTKTL